MIYLIYGTIFLLSFIVLITLLYGVWYLSNIIFGYWIPNVSTNKLLYDTLLNNLSLKRWDTFIDLWCWDWEVVSLVSNKFPDTQCIGYEYWPRAYKRAIKFKEENNWMYKLYHKDFFKVDLSEASVIYCFLIPHLMKKVWKKINNECKPETLVYSNSFPIPEVEPILQLTVKSEHWTIKTIYVYKVSWNNKVL